MPIKSFRGLIADGAIDTINLHTNNGSTGYKIVKFEIMQKSPGAEVGEHIVKIFTIPQTTATSTIDFSDNTLLAAAFLKTHTSQIYADTNAVIFDNIIFNQDIDITHVDVATGGTDEPINYHIELEQVNLSLDENTVATLKDIRNIESQ
tara:strand:+ start:1255 stop:1701 length:447 start_codon:yes stop_codon:yes gene_type:complete